MTYLHGDISKTSINMADRRKIWRKELKEKKKYIKKNMLIIIINRLRVDLFQTFRRLSEANHVIGPVVILVFDTGE